VAAGEVQLDQGISAGIDRTLGIAGSSPSPRAEELAAGHQVAVALADKLVIEIRDLGFQAQRGTTLPPGVQNGLLVTGQFLAVDQGSEAKRVAIGLGAGRSDVRVQAQVFEVTPHGQRLAEEIEVDARSGLPPGMAETMGLGALAHHLLVSTAASAGVGLPRLGGLSNVFARGVHPCPRHVHRMRRSSGGRWLSWSAPGATRPTGRARSSRPRRRSAPGSCRPTWPEAAGRPSPRRPRAC
jgi:hypothetical protein